MLQAATKGLSSLGPQPERNPDHRVSRPRAFREATIPCRTGTYLLRWESFIEKTRFACTPAEAESYLRTSVVRKRPLLGRYTHMAELIYEASPGSDLTWETRPGRY